ncbi:MAG: dTDP-glucose 4,6-dehydratase [Pirellulaceae bacterium]
MKRLPAILVTGGAGFIGSCFVRQQISRGDVRVVNLDSLTYAGNLASLDFARRDPRHVFVQGDIADSQLVGELLAEHRPHAMVHFAAESHVDRSIDGPANFVMTNVVGTVQLLETACKYYRGLSESARRQFRFLHVSTDEVFGSLGAEGVFHETTPYAPNSPYSASKAAADHFVRAFHHTYGLPCLTTHCSNNYGPYQFPEKLIPLMILNAAASQPLPVYGTGANVRDWLHVDDHCQALQRVLERGRPGECYNVGGDCEQTNLDVVKAICGVMDELRPRDDGSPRSSQIRFVADRPGHDLRYAVDCTKLRTELDWRPQVDFHSGLRRTVAWYLTNADWIETVQGGEARLARRGVRAA